MKLPEYRIVTVINPFGKNKCFAERKGIKFLFYTEWIVLGHTHGEYSYSQCIDRIKMDMESHFEFSKSEDITLADIKFITQDSGPDRETLKLAEELRQQCNKLSGEEREKLREEALKIINGEAIDPNDPN